MTLLSLVAPGKTSHKVVDQLAAISLLVINPHFLILFILPVLF